MPFCVRCGTKHDDTANYCPNCGLAFAKAQTDDKEEQKGASGPDFQENLKHIVDTKDTTGDFDKNDIEQNRVMAILAYLGILVIIPIAAAKNSKFATYHANQGLILLIAELILSAAASVSSAFFGLLNIGFFIALYHITVWPLSLLLLALVILGIYNAASGKARELPVIGRFRLLKY
jgi:uncharacterized membrane protein